MASTPTADQRRPRAAKPPKPLPTQLDAHLGFWLRFVSNHVSARFRQQVEDHGVSVSEWVAMRHLYDDAQSTPAALMAALGMSKGAVSKIVSRLEAKGYATRGGDLADKRAQSIALTPSGRRLVPALAALADQNDEWFFGTLSASTRRQLMSILQELVQQHGLQQIPTE